MSMRAEKIWRLRYNIALQFSIISHFLSQFLCGPYSEKVYFFRSGCLIIETYVSFRRSVLVLHERHLRYEFLYSYYFHIQIDFESNYFYIRCFVIFIYKEKLYLTESFFFNQTSLLNDNSLILKIIRWELSISEKNESALFLI